MVCRYKYKFDEILVMNVNSSEGLFPYKIHKISKARKIGFNQNKNLPDCSSFTTTKKSI